MAVALDIAFPVAHKSRLGISIKNICFHLIKIVADCFYFLDCIGLLPCRCLVILFKGKDQFLPIMGPVEGIYTEEELHHVRMLYAEKVTMVDRQFGYLLDQLRRLGLERDTLVLVVSDHGEPMGNGKHGHGIMRKCRPWPYEELVHAVMMLRAPGLPAGKRIKSFVQSVDVAPTVCEWLGIGVHPDMHGKSLLPLVRGEVDKVRDFAIAGYHKFSWAIYTEDWSYIHWLRKGDSSSQSSLVYDMYVQGVMDTGKNVIDDVLRDKYSKSSVVRADDFNKKESEEQRKYREAATLDGEDQWTCTPGSVAALPEEDELYDRRNDPFQLHNVIAEHPEEAKKLLLMLKDFIQEVSE